jgi:hypothetical protein
MLTEQQQQRGHLANVGAALHLWWPDDEALSVGEWHYACTFHAHPTLTDVLVHVRYLE